MNVKRYDYTPYTGPGEVRVDGEPLARAEWFVLASDYDSLLAAAREAEKAWEKLSPIVKAVLTIYDSHYEEHEMLLSDPNPDSMAIGIADVAAAFARLREYTK